ncbi:hypothetical protein [Shewanella sp. GD04112]|uniref:LEM-3-like GIY-YIG domain-containing protein n=1 Tax=Shewanella sp. GD04112 TaxID=2975434 RepID=UPI002449011C|nr:hypothetical protein [Shewanella sp. GD04112]MDH0450858.1 hypothetical protein [Shewanella sp. GD04112]
MKFSQRVKEHLGFYVYALIDPFTGKIFYVGKASGNNRAFDHLKENVKESRKTTMIDQIRSLGREPLVEILRSGLSSEDVAFEVEAAIIDSIGMENLTNEVRGHGVSRGRMKVEELKYFDADPICVSNIDEKCMMFFINRTYSPTLSENRLYDYVRQFWHNVSAKKRESLEYKTALAIVDSTVVEVYNIVAWYPAGTTLSTRVYQGDSDSNRWEFVGQKISEHTLYGKRLVDESGDDLTANQLGYGYIN